MSEDKEKKEEKVANTEKVKDSTEKADTTKESENAQAVNNDADAKNVEEIKESVTTSATDNNNQMRYSGFWVRGAAHLIDGLIISFAALFILVPISIFIGVISAFLGPFGVFLQFMSGFLGLFLAWAYFIFMTHKYQATFGKMAVGVKVYAESGEELTLSNIILRETIGKIVSSIIFGIGYVMIAFTGKKQGLHDIIAKSVVTYNNPIKGPNTVAVVITYVIYGILTFISIVLITMFGVALSFLIASATSNSNGIGGLFDDIKSSFEEGSMSDLEYYIDDDDYYMDDLNTDEFDYMMQDMDY